MQRIASNPIQFVTDLIGEIRQLPNGQAMLQAALGQQLEQQQPAQKWEMPKGRRFKTEGGQEVELFEASQVQDMLSHFRSEMEQMFQGELQPFQDWREQQEEQQHIIGIIHQSREETAQLMEDMRSLPHFKEHEPQIAQVLDRMDPQWKRSLGAVASLHTAFQIVLRDIVYPKLEKATEEKVRQRDREKANASTGQVQPGQQQPAAQKVKPKTPEELSKHMAALAAARAS